MAVEKDKRKSGQNGNSRDPSTEKGGAHYDESLDRIKYNFGSQHKIRDGAKQLLEGGEYVDDRGVVCDSPEEVTANNEQYDAEMTTAEIWYDRIEDMIADDVYPDEEEIYLEAAIEDAYFAVDHLQDYNPEEDPYDLILMREYGGDYFGDDSMDMFDGSQMTGFGTGFGNNVNFSVDSNFNLIMNDNPFGVSDNPFAVTEPTTATDPAAEATLNGTENGAELGGINLDNLNFGTEQNFLTNPWAAGTTSGTPSFSSTDPPIATDVTPTSDFAAAAAPPPPAEPEAPGVTSPDAANDATFDEEPAPPATPAQAPNVPKFG